MKGVMPWLIVLTLTASAGYFSMREPRGIRNKNPLNIEKGDNWQGLRSVQTDSRFCQFTDHRYGYRAAARILSNYAARGTVRLNDIISTWAPSHENNVDAYVGTVCRINDWNHDKVIGPDDWPRLLSAMTVVENGKNPYSLADITEGVSWA